LEFLHKQRSNLKTPLELQVEQIYLMTFSKECNDSTTIFLDEEKEQFLARGKQYLSWYRKHYFPFDQAITMSVEE
jgi:hypothetical protein